MDYNFVKTIKTGELESTVSWLPLNASAQDAAPSCSESRWSRFGASSPPRISHSGPTPPPRQSLSSSLHDGQKRPSIRHGSTATSKSPALKSLTAVIIGVSIVREVRAWWAVTHCCPGAKNADILHEPPWSPCTSPSGHKSCDSCWHQ